MKIEMYEFEALETWIEAKITKMINDRLGGPSLSDDIQEGTLRNDLIEIFGIP